MSIGWKSWRESSCDVSKFFIGEETRKGSFTREHVQLLECESRETSVSHKYNEALVSQSNTKASRSKALSDRLIVIHDGSMKVGIDEFLSTDVSSESNEIGTS